VRRKSIICLFLTLATLAVFWQVRHHDFINLDDPLYVSKNLHVQQGLNGKSVLWAFTNGHAGFWIPLTWISFMLDFELWGLNPGGYHLTNLIFHIANTLLLFLLFRKMTQQTWQSAFVAALFALHPLRVETVAWVTERKYVLSTFFWILTMWTYGRYTERPGPFRYLLALLTFASSLMANQIAVTLPFVLLLMDCWPLGRFQPGLILDESYLDVRKPKDPKKERMSVFRLIWEKAPFFFLAAVFSIVAFLTQRKVGATLSVDSLPIATRISNALVSYVTYICKMIWPSKLAVFYPHPGGSLPMWQVTGAALLLLGISIGVIRTLRRRPYLTVGWFWYLGTLVPVIGLVQVGDQAMADRFTYIPLIGLFIMIVWGVSEFLLKRRHLEIPAFIVAALVLAVLCIRSWHQVQYWRNSVTLFDHTLKVTTQNSLIHTSLGNVLTQQGKYDLAMAHLTKAVQLKPEHPSAHINLAVALMQLGKLEEAITHYTKALQLDPENSVVYSNLGNALAAQGRLDEAIINFSQALRIDPDNAMAHNNLANALVMKKRYDQAIKHYYRAVEIRPDYADAHNNLGIVLAHEGRLDEAIIHFSEAVWLNPDHAQARANLGRALQQRKSQ
jgi:Flp pilus assembly protein TadD